MDNVIQFPNANSSNKALRDAAKGKKVSQKKALSAMVETHQMMQALQNTMGRLANSQVGLEQVLERLDMNFNVLMKMLQDLEVFDDEKWEAAWEKYVVKPQEEALTKHIEELKQKSAEDAYFGHVMELVRKHEFEEFEQDGQNITSKAQRDYYINMLANPAIRRQVLEAVRQKIPYVPVADFTAFEQAETEKVRDPEETDVDQKHPNCHYCGKDDCEFCNPPKTECPNNCEENKGCSECSKKEE
jgi:hypothetical protein